MSVSESKRPDKGRSHPFRDQAKFWLNQQFGQIELLKARYVTHSFVPHSHEGYAIGVALAGAEGFTYRGQEHVLSAGEIVVIHPGEVHTGQAVNADGWVYRMFYPEASILQRAAAEVFGRWYDRLPFFAKPVLQDDSLAQLMVKMHTIFEDETTSKLERESWLLWTLAQLVLRHEERPPAISSARPERSYVKRIRHYLEECYGENIALADLGDLVSMSPFHLLRAFKDEVGLPPHAYLLQVRIRQAKQLLLEGQPLSDVALQTGFADQSHFTKRFKRVVGVAPGQYRPVGQG